jgi:hypothetical protein
LPHSDSYKRILTRLGYYNYQQGLIYRHIGQENGWDSHLGNCRKFILEAVGYYCPDKVTVLGSGWLLDLPLAEMLDSVASVTLVDIVHPPQVIEQVAKYKNATLAEIDLTGGLIEQVWRKCGNSIFSKKLKTLDVFNVPEFEPESDPGLVISLNILTQLETLIVDFLRKRTNINEAELTRFRTEIQNRHIDFLLKHHSVLISDVAEIFKDKSGNLKTVTTMLTGPPTGRFKKEWTWNFDLKGSDFYTTSSVMKVVAVTI